MTTLAARLQRIIATGLCLTCSGSLSWAQLPESIQPKLATGSALLRPYRAAFVPPIRMNNSSRIASLIRSGTLYLTVQDTVALALENNIDIEVSRYNPIYDEWELQRFEAGGALPGVPSSASQVGSVASGQGVSGSQSAAGVSGTGANTNAAGSGNATISQVGPTTPNLDPALQENTTFSHRSSPQPNATQSRVRNLIQNTRNYTDSLNAGFLTGTTATVTYKESYLNENAPSDVLNPTYAPSISASVQQQLLQGFGIAVNARNITVWKANLQIADLNFRGQVIGIVANVLNQYYGLVADYEDLAAKRSALAVAQQFYNNNRREVEIGVMAPLDVTTAEAQVASSQQNVIISETTLEDQQTALKNLISRNGLADPLLASARIVPLDRIVVPYQDDLPPLKSMIEQARKSRTDISVERLTFTNAQTSALGTASGVLPQLTAFASASQAGLAGPPQLVPVSGSQVAATAGQQQYRPGFRACPAPNTNVTCEAPDPYFVGGIGNALGQMFRRNYPSERAGAYLNSTIRNRVAQADFAIDQLSLRQSELQDQKDQNQIAVDVSNQLTGLRQARVRYQAAVRNRTLQEQLLAAEQKKFSLGVSTTYLVVQQQRDLSTAQSTAVASLVAYSNARVALGQTLGSTLEENNISVKEALAGRVVRPSSLPEALPQGLPQTLPPPQ